MTQHLRPNPNALAETTAARALISAAIILNALHLLGISYRAREVYGLYNSGFVEAQLVGNRSKHNTMCI